MHFLHKLLLNRREKNNILDRVFASDPDLIRDCKVGEKLSGCDHHLIWFNIKTEYKLTGNKTKTPDYRKANFNRARQLLSPAAWNRLTLTDADTADRLQEQTLGS